MAPLISLQDVGKAYRSASGEMVVALTRVDLTIQEGEFVCIIGPSGCGKSTLLKMVAGLVPATHGRLSLGGKEIAGPSDKVGMVFQSPVLLPWRTVLENVLLPIRVKRLNLSKYRERALELLHLVGLGEFVNSYPFELSGGMQQRNAIARALITDPSLLLMDEPFGALDALTREQLMVELRRIWRTQRSTVLFVTHSLQEAVFLADRVVIFSPRPGTVVETIDVRLPRERDLEIMGTDAFNVVANRARRLLVPRDSEGESTA